jgi:CO/xanthine dehydrogenase Mo-binding subunit
MNAKPVKNIGHMLGIPWSKIRIIAPYVGGGFGGRVAGSAIYSWVKSVSQSSWLKKLS